MSKEDKVLDNVIAYISPYLKKQELKLEEGNKRIRKLEYLITKLKEKSDYIEEKVEALDH